MPAWLSIRTTVQLGGFEPHVLRQRRTSAAGSLPEQGGLAIPEELHPSRRLGSLPAMSSTFGMAELGLPSHLAAELDSHSARSVSLGGRLGSFQDAGAELSYRCSSMPGAFSSIADR